MLAGKRTERSVALGAEKLQHLTWSSGILYTVNALLYAFGINLQSDYIFFGGIGFLLLQFFMLYSGMALIKAYEDPDNFTENDSKSLFVVNVIVGILTVANIGLLLWLIA